MGKLLKDTNAYADAKNRLEYHERQGFHHELRDIQEGTFGWTTIMKDVTDFEIKAFDIFLEYASGKKKGWKTDEVLKYRDAFLGYIKELDRMNMTISKTTKP
jgi:hypothetical protein